MAIDADLLSACGGRTFSCHTYTGWPDNACNKLKFWSCEQCEHRKFSEEMSAVYIDYQMHVHNRQGQLGIHQSTSEESESEYIFYSVEQEQLGTDWPSEEVGVEYLEYQMRVNNYQEQYDTDWLSLLSNLDLSLVLEAQFPAAAVIPVLKEFTSQGKTIKAAQR